MKKQNHIKLLLVSIMIFAATALWATNVTVKVVASDGTTPISGVTIWYGSGTNTGAYFPGTTTPSSGELSATLNPGTYSFRAGYHNGGVTQSSLVITGDSKQQ